MRVIAKEECFIGNVLRRVGDEFEYHVEAGESLPPFLSAVGSTDVQQWRNEQEAEKHKALDAVAAAAGPKRQKSGGVTRFDDIV